MNSMICKECSAMYMQQSIVKCESGLYNRQATYFIQKANEF